MTNNKQHNNIESHTICNFIVLFLSFPPTRVRTMFTIAGTTDGYGMRPYND